ncbi:MAG: spore coat protein CotH, partial [Clostridia bacterium]|nr:spore coat protein CotH [Clostridia bacterium]
MKKLIKIICFLTAVSILFSACSSKQNVKEENMENTYKPDTNYNEKYKLRDKKDLYTAYNPEDVVTMYLTVSTGNEGEGTNHTWSEINTYSVYDYDSMGVDRYKVEGLLQI